MLFLFREMYFFVIPDVGIRLRNMGRKVPGVADDLARSSS